MKGELKVRGLRYCPSSEFSTNTSFAPKADIVVTNDCANDVISHSPVRYNATILPCFAVVPKLHNEEMEKLKRKENGSHGLIEDFASHVMDESIESDEDRDSHRTRKQPTSYSGNAMEPTTELPQQTESTDNLLPHHSGMFFQSQVQSEEIHGDKYAVYNNTLERNQSEELTTESESVKEDGAEQKQSSQVIEHSSFEELSNVTIGELRSSEVGDTSNRIDETMTPEKTIRKTSSEKNIFGNTDEVMNIANVEPSITQNTNAENDVNFNGCQRIDSKDPEIDAANIVVEAIVTVEKPLNSIDTNPEGRGQASSNDDRKHADLSTPISIPNASANNVALDVESKALVGSSSEKKATIVDVEKSKQDAKKNRGKALRQVIAALIANLGTINTGLVFGFAAVTNPQLQDPSSSILVDKEQASWIASLSSVSTPVGCILSGWLMDKIGRKLTLILTEIPAILGLLLISVSTDLHMIYAGRLLVGLGSGMVGAPARVYTSEVTQPHLRGMLSALASVGVSLGIVIEYILGSLMAWYLMAGISAIIPMLALILILFVPETPNWLLQRGRTEEARESLRKLRGGNCDVDKELDDLMCFAAKNNVVRLKGMKETFSALMKPSTLKPFGILVMYFLIYQFTGVNPVTFYAVEIFEFTGTGMNKNLATVILGIVRLISTIVACIASRRCGRRPLTMISAIGCGITMVGLGSYLYIREGWLAENVEPVVTWFPVACIFIFIIASTIGFLVVPWVMIGEVYPTQIRGIAGGLTTCSAHICVFIVVKTFPEFVYWFGIPGTFWMYGGISLFGCIFFYLYLPETKGRTLQEIEDYFYGRVKKLGEKCPSTANMPKVLDVPKGQMLP